MATLLRIWGGYLIANAGGYLWVNGGGYLIANTGGYLDAINDSRDYGEVGI